MAHRMVVLIPSIGPPEVLPSNVSPAHVLSVGPVLSSKLTRHRELFWSTSSYQHHEVNDFATTVVGYTIKGDACVVEESARQLTGSIDDLLNVWRGRKHTQRDVLAQLHDPSRAPQRPITTATNTSQEYKQMSMDSIPLNPKGNPTNLESEAILPGDDSCPAPVITVKENRDPLRVPPPHTQNTARMYPSSLVQQAPARRRQFRRKVVLETIANAGTSNSNSAEPDIVEWEWDDLHPDVLGQICMKVSSCATIIALSGACTQWRKCIISDKPLLKCLLFSLDVARPLRNTCDCCAVIQKMLHRRHIGSLPQILLKAGDSGNISAYTTLANLYEACDMHFDALKYWRILSHLGDPWGCWKHGEMLYSGRNGISRDIETAHRLLLKSGKQVQKSDHPRKKELLSGVGMCLGYLFLDGEVGCPDNQRAVQWFQIAAQNGATEAQRTLGWMFNTGQYG